MLKSVLKDMFEKRTSGSRESFPKRAPPKANSHNLHLGCGSNILEGWLNVDLESQSTDVFCWDLRRPLPFDSGSAQLIFNEHFIEHIERSEALALLRECRRVLEPAGTLRISTPNLSKLLTEYHSRRLIEWLDVGWAPRTPCQLLNEGMHLWGHRFLYDIPEFESILSEAGFETITHAGWRDSSDPRLRNLECRPYHEEIIVEARA